MHPQKLYIFYTIQLFLFSVFISCTSKEAKKQNVESSIEGNTVRNEKGSVTSTVANGLAYSYYIPAYTKENEKRPALIFFDPHGDGSYPLKKYSALADKFHFILVGSNDIKNGIELAEARAIGMQLINETLNRFHCKSDGISLAGFSGGGKVALVLSEGNMSINAVTCSGAALAPGSLHQLPPTLGIAGKADMNYTEVISFINSLESEAHCAVFEWNGKHEWPDTTTFIHSFYRSVFGRITTDTALVGEYESMQKQLIKNATSSIEKANLYSEAIQILHNFPQKNEFAQQLGLLLKSSSFSKAKSAQQSELQKENTEKEMLIDAFDKQDLKWWKEKTTELNKNNNPISKRLLGYISLASYSLSNRSLSSGNTAMTEKILNIYAIADPENAEQPFLMAKLLARIGKNEEVIIDLKRSIKMGLQNPERINTDPDLQTVLKGKTYEEIR